MSLLFRLSVYAFLAASAAPKRRLFYLLARCPTGQPTASTRSPDDAASGGSYKELIRLPKDKLRAEREEWAKKEAMFEKEILGVCRENSEFNLELTAKKDDNRQLLEQLTDNNFKKPARKVGASVGGAAKVHSVAAAAGEIGKTSTPSPAGNSGSVLTGGEKVGGAAARHGGFRGSLERTAATTTTTTTPAAATSLGFLFGETGMRFSYSYELPAQEDPVYFQHQCPFPRQPRRHHMHPGSRCQ
ncbi:unnamed protein product [Vitrella brassicaformis CCMP3155]|uniref:Uncharacterized protein n=1 Tax=Vitrella brassicaformis (strain CCMP3155) TaxID=1169540 RepID=A0A0G4EPS3_VITBC|nr:unnamed protein product [Vitrella brassicaformis CCMP3155]|eukprot:CEL99561.1 unnamed protein product [Vitrella brassicaformis CCMP3155]